MNNPNQALLDMILSEVLDREFDPADYYPQGDGEAMISEIDSE